MSTLKAYTRTPRNTIRWKFAFRCASVPNSFVFTSTTGPHRSWHYHFPFESFDRSLVVDRGSSGTLPFVEGGRDLPVWSGRKDELRDNPRQVVSGSWGPRKCSGRSTLSTFLPTYPEVPLSILHPSSTFSGVPGRVLVVR